LIRIGYPKLDIYNKNLKRALSSYKLKYY